MYCTSCTVMVLYLIGLGLGDEKDITVRGLDIIRTKCDLIFLEAYTSVLSESAQQIQVEKLQRLYSDGGGTVKSIVIADRTLVENDADDKITLHNKLAKGFNHLPRGIGALVAIGQDQARGGEVEREPEHGGDQQDRWE